MLFFVINSSCKLFCKPFCHFQPKICKNSDSTLGLHSEKSWRKLVFPICRLLASNLWLLFHFTSNVCQISRNFHFEVLGMSYLPNFWCYGIPKLLVLISQNLHFSRHPRTIWQKFIKLEFQAKSVFKTVFQRNCSKVSCQVQNEKI